MNKLYAAADRAVNQALRIRKGEKYLLVTDTQKLEIAEALAFYAKQAGAEVTTYLMTETLRPITEPTRQFKELIRERLGHDLPPRGPLRREALPGLHGRARGPSTAASA